MADELERQVLLRCGVPLMLRSLAASDALAGEPMSGVLNAAALRIERDAARIKELEAGLEQIELLASNHGGWFETDPWKWGSDMGSIARAALSPPETSDG